MEVFIYFHPFHVFGLSAPLFLDETFRSNTRLWADERVDKLAAKPESWNVPIGSGQPDTRNERAARHAGGQPGTSEAHGLLGIDRALDLMERGEQAASASASVVAELSAAVSQTEPQATMEAKTNNISREHPLR